MSDICFRNLLVYGPYMLTGYSRLFSISVITPNSNGGGHLLHW